MANRISTTELEAFLDEALPPERMAAIENALRGGDAKLTDSLAEINGRRDAGLHSLGAIWRRHGLTCASREQLGSFLLDVMPPDEADYLRFHLEEVACRRCRANLEDLQARQSSAEAKNSSHRRRKYYESSVGRLKGEA